MSLRHHIGAIAFWAVIAAVPAAGQLEVAGLIIDQTRTPSGHSFYQQFFTRWGEPTASFPYNLVVKELPDARGGSFLMVEVNGVPAWRKAVRPRTGRFDEEVEECVTQVTAYLLSVTRTNGERTSGDLAGDEW